MHRDYSQAVTELGERQLTALGVAGFVYDIVDLAAALEPTATSCAVTVRVDGTVTVANSDELAGLLQVAQDADEGGQALSAQRRGEPVEIADLRDADRDSAYYACALKHGIRSSLSLPLITQGVTLGTLSLYRGEPNAFGHHRRALGRYAQQAAFAVAILQRQDEQQRLAEQLRHALTTRPVIDQVLGILMAQQHCTSAEAFELLRAHSQNTNRKLRVVAADIVTNVSGSPLPPSPEFDEHRGAPQQSTLARGARVELDEQAGLLLAGDLDLSHRLVLQTALTGALAYAARGSDTELHLNVVGLDSLDVGSARLLVRAADVVHRRGGTLILRGPQPGVLRVLESGWGSAQSVHFTVRVA